MTMSIARHSLERELLLANVDTALCVVGEPSFLEDVSDEHIGQVLQLMPILSVKCLIYVSTSKTGVLCIALVLLGRQTD